MLFVSGKKCNCVYINTPKGQPLVWHAFRKTALDPPHRNYEHRETSFLVINPKKWKRCGVLLSACFFLSKSTETSFLCWMVGRLLLQEKVVEQHMVNDRLRHCYAPQGNLNWDTINNNNQGTVDWESSVNIGSIRMRDKKIHLLSTVNLFAHTKKMKISSSR